MKSVYSLVLIFLFNINALSQKDCRLELIVIPDYGEFGYSVKVFSDSSTISKKMLVVDSSGVIILGKEVKANCEANTMNRNNLVVKLTEYLNNSSVGVAKYYSVRREYRIETEGGAYVMTPNLPKSFMTQFEMKLEELILRFIESFSISISYKRS